MKTISEIKQELQTADEQTRAVLLETYRQDSRSGVVSLVRRFEKEAEKLERERERIEQMKMYEKKYDHLGLICGIDEAGRGPLAGPVVAGAVILPADHEILWLNDSKQLSAKKKRRIV